MKGIASCHYNAYEMYCQLSLSRDKTCCLTSIENIVLHFIEIDCEICPLTVSLVMISINKLNAIKYPKRVVPKIVFCHLIYFDLKKTQLSFLQFRFKYNRFNTLPI